MPLQLGTVDGLINITEDKILCFVKAIDEFANLNGIGKSREIGISLGAAFQRFVEPVYKDSKLSFQISSINNPVLTRNGKEQSPARVTFCRKMGLLNIDDANDIFSLTPLGRKILNKEISICEYAFILLSKQGIFYNNLYNRNLVAVISEWFINHCTITEEDFRKFITEKFHDNEIEKTRLDIILNGFAIANLLTNIDKGVYVLADLNAAEIFRFILSNEKSFNPAIKDDAPQFISYIGGNNFGIYDLIQLPGSNVLNAKYPNIRTFEEDMPRQKCFGNGKVSAEGYKKYLFALKTKPFLLLAGISGTGKSRIVKQMAFDSCPDVAALRQDLTSPGNYCLVEVKPNWHDSTELLGYVSRIGSAHYVLTQFVKFLAKAMLHPEVPHFVCLDEMNLAPVEQYFAEFLSVLESRTKVGDHIVSEPLIKAEMFGKLISEAALFGREEEMPSDYYGFTTDDRAESYGKEHSVFETLQREGLRIPENVVIVGTVNMDETTHQLSRKVIDRAMTIEMNLPEGKPFKDFFENPADLEYRATPASKDLYLATETKAKDVVAQLAEADSGQTEWLKEEVAKFLTELNAALNGTPFKVAYRVQNELMLYFFQMWRENPNAEADWGKILNTSCDQILMMKVLPRIEGDDDLLGGVLNPDNGTLSKFIQPYGDSAKKVADMWERLDNSRFTSFWP